MEIQILGTSSGAPSKQRNVSASIIKYQQSKQWCLVDCGEGTQHQLMHTTHSLANLQVVFITHVHGDHCYGLPGLVASAAMSGRTEPLIIVGPQAVLDWLLATRVMSESRSHFELDLKPVEELSGRLPLGGFLVESYTLSHRVPCWAYGFYETAIKKNLNQDKLRQDGIEAGPIWGQLQQGKDVELKSGFIKAADYLLPPRRSRKVIIAGDNDRPDILSAAVTDADVLVHEATYTQEVSDRVGSWPQHSSAQMVAEFAQQSDLRNLLLIHFSPRYHAKDSDERVEAIYQEAATSFHGRLFTACDFDRFELDLEGRLHRIEVNKQ
ncbi:ribonuclease Z [Marinicella sp. W31]|uniref:ribonuclease Z n=1 Tax=Marinicella sp. W31 TaxID=3023713 RepID=UPI0037575BEE